MKQGTGGRPPSRELTSPLNAIVSFRLPPPPKRGVIHWQHLFHECFISMLSTITGKTPRGPPADAAELPHFSRTSSFHFSKSRYIYIYTHAYNSIYRDRSISEVFSQNSKTYFSTKNRFWCSLRI